MAETFFLKDGTCCQAERSEVQGALPVVFIHGVGMSHRFWAPQMKAFAGQRSCVAYDMLGHGESPLPPEKAKLEDYATQLDRVLDASGFEKAIIVGHSMGALVTLQYALTKPERAAGIVPMNAVFQRSAAQKAAVLKRLAELNSGEARLDVSVTLKRWFGDVPAPEATEAFTALKQALEQVNPVGYSRSYALFATSDEVHAAGLKHLAMPACFLTGEFDPNSTPAMSEAMARLAPQGYAVSLPGERHMMSFISPAAIDAVLSQFFAQVDAASMTD